MNLAKPEHLAENQWYNWPWEVGSLARAACPSAYVYAHHKDHGILSGARGGAGRDSWQGRVSPWPVWQANEKTGRPPGSVFIQGLAEVLPVLSGSVDANAASPSTESSISCQPEPPQACSVFVAQACQGVRLLEFWLFYPHLWCEDILPLLLWGCEDVEEMREC